MKTKECYKCGRRFPYRKSARQCDLCKYLADYWSKRPYRAGDPNRPPMSYIPVPCECCGKLTPRSQHISNARWCSDKCRTRKRNRDAGVSPRKVKSPEYCKVSFNSCGVCGSGYTISANGGTVAGCAKCIQRWGAYNCTRIAAGSYEVECPVCAIKYCNLPSNGGGVAAGCSDECRQEIRRADKRKYKAFRRKHINGGEAFDPYEIFWRDKWRCTHCGCRTHRKYRGTCHDSAPELDHIIPVSKGGGHTRANTQLLCRSCNAQKGDGALHDQLLLLG